MHQSLFDVVKVKVYFIVLQREICLGLKNTATASHKINSEMTK